MKYFPRILILFCGVSVALLIAEITLRVMHVNPVIVNEWMLDTVDKRASATYIFEKNDTQCHAYDAPQGIAVIGDSYSEARLWQSRGIDSYPEQLQQLLRDRPIADAKVWNFGVGANGPDQELRKLMDEIGSLHPKILVWQLYPNDVWDAVTIPLYDLGSDGELRPIAGWRNWMYLRQRFYQAVPGRILLTQHSRVFRAVLASFQRLQFSAVPKKYREDAEQWGLAKLQKEIRAVDTIAAGYGITVVHVLIPPQSLYLPEGSSDKDWNIGLYDDLADILSKEPHNVIVRFPDNTDTLRKYYLDTEDVNAVGDKHLTEVGHAVVATAVYDAIAPFLISP
jgi:hypothetical protein